MLRIRWTQWALVVGASAASSSGAWAAQVSNPPAQPPPPATEHGAASSFWDALTQGTPKLDVRFRAEFADQDGLKGSEAYTVRTRLGYGTRTWKGFSGYVEMEDVRSPDDDAYNSTLNDNPDKTVIADPAGTELNEAWLGYEAAEQGLFRTKLGRQTITFDDHRFVGDVGWRQDNQTFDAAWLRSGLGVERLTATYAYLGQINRIYAQEADWSARSHLVNVGYAASEVVNVTGFAYLLDFEDDSPANSCQTYGARCTGSAKLGEGTALEYAASFAAQADYGDNPLSYDAPYYALDLGLKLSGAGTFGAGYEVLGSDDGAKGFATPLATLHKFNGYADKFLNTPVDGLEDLYVYARSSTLPGGLTGILAYHAFSADEGSADYGEELDAVLTKRVNDRVVVGAKYAQFWGDDPAYADVSKFMLDLTFAF
ncbi:MAG: alginate export family protein [Planctomycetes bacterium]|nr:alginate export family protein [Planctomycetota bacterium]